MKTLAFLFVVSCLLQCFQLTSSIECYECTSFGGSSDHACNDPFDASSSAVTICNGAQCHKSSTKAEAAGVSIETVVRRCLPVSVLPNSCEGTSAGGASITACHCSTDRCNTGQVVRQFSPVLMLGASAVILFYFSLE